MTAQASGISKNASKGPSEHTQHVPLVLRSLVDSSRSWDKLAPSLVALGVALIDRAPSDATSATGFGFGGGVHSASGLWGAKLGRDLLKDVFVASPASRETIMTKAKLY